LLVGIGLVLLVWGGIGAFSGLRARRREHISSGGPVS
jgi:hypothetical protein